MKKITFLLLFVMGCCSLSYSQCSNSSQYPFDSVASNNMGLVQEITTCAHTGEYSSITNLAIGFDYLFTCVSNDDTVNKYITVKDLNNNTIAHGFSPLTVNAISVSSIRLHYNENAACLAEENCHTITMQSLLTCPIPTDIAINDITTTGASFEWTPGTETAWEVLVLAQGDEAPTSATSGTAVVDNPVYSTNNLVAATQYSFYVRANCGSEFSPWSVPHNFASGCEDMADFNENFDTTDQQTLPICWTAVLNGASEYAYIETIGYNSSSGENAVEMNNSDSPPNADIILASPSLSTLSAGTYRLKFSGRSYDSVTVEVGTLDAASSNGVFSSIQNVVLNANYNEFTIDFTDYVGTDTFVAIRHSNTNSYSSVFLDDIRWELAPLCPDVTAIQAYDVTTTEASISWQPGGSETQWDLVYGTVLDTDPDLLVPVTPIPADSPNTIISNLTENTTYKVWVRSKCQQPDEDGGWIGPMIFTSACLPIDNFNENFDETSDLPLCWSAILSGSYIPNNASVGVVEYSAASGSNCIEMRSADSSEDANIILVSPNLGNLGAGTHRLKLKARSVPEGSIEIGTLDGNNAFSNFTSVETVPLTATYTEYVVDFTSYSGTDNYLGIRHASGEYVSIFLDDLLWEVNPACPDVSEIQVSDTTTESAFITWSNNGPETQWDIVYGAVSVTDPNTLTPITPAPASVPEATITGLADNTAYKIWVRSACGGTDGNGAWIGPVVFKTACFATELLNEDFESTAYGNLPDCWTSVITGETVSPYAQVATIDYGAFSGSNAVLIENDESGPADYVMLVSPNLNTIAAATHRLKFYAFRYEWGEAGTLNIGTMEGNTSNATFTSFQEVAIGTEYMEYTVDFTSYSGTDTYLAIRNTSGFYTPIFLDDIRWEVAPLCPDVQGIEISGITNVASTVSWSPGGPETNWQVAYGGTDVTDPNTLVPSALLAETNFPLNGLTQNTGYKVWVRSACGAPNGDGAWIGPISFKTQCDATDVPYNEDFESAENYALPNCTSNLNVGTGNDWTVLDAPTDNFTSKTLAYEYNYQNPADTWFFTRGINLTAGTEYTISYRYGNSGESPENLKVAYGGSADANGMTEEIADHNGINNDANETNVQTFTPSATGVYYFGFNAYSEENQNLLLVDDIAVYNALGNENFNASSFKFYPNPVKDILNLSYMQNITSVTVYNLLGQKVFENTLNANSTQVDMSHLSSGSYLVKVTANNQTKTIKIIKE